MGNHSVTCPQCGDAVEFEGDVLPDCACDETEIICEGCQSRLYIGWTAVAEVRRSAAMVQQPQIM